MLRNLTTVNGSSIVWHLRQSLNHSPVVGLAMMLLVASSGCQEETKGGPRVDVRPVMGKLLVDGKPVEGIAISFTRTSDRGVDFAVPNPEGMTDKEGEIKATTYLWEDGCPPGDYTLTFQWTSIDRMSGNTSGDKFKGKFNVKEKSEHKVSIPKGNGSFDLGTIEIKTR